MEIRFTTKQILTVLHVLSWVIFLGVMVDAGAMIANTFITVFIKPSGIQDFWRGSDYLASIHSYNRSHFITLALVMIIVNVLKSIMFYCIVKLTAKSKRSLSRPFIKELTECMIKLSYLALGIGLFSHCGYRFTRWLTEQGLQQSNLHELYIDGADVWLFMAVILYILVHVVRRGVEMQKENGLII